MLVLGTVLQAAMCGVEAGTETLKCIILKDKKKAVIWHTNILLLYF